jgi:hypothetical protein
LNGSASKERFATAESTIINCAGMRFAHASVAGEGRIEKETFDD